MPLVVVTAATLKVGLSAVTVSGTGIVTATQFVGDGSELTGVSGFATALSSDQTSVLNRFFKTPEEIPIGAGTSVSITSDDASGNVAFCREGNYSCSSWCYFPRRIWNHLSYKCLRRILINKT